MSAHFKSDLEVRKIGERTWLLINDLVFYSEYLRGELVAPAGMQTDLASIPRLAYVVYPPVGRYDAAAVIHDAGYINALKTSKHQKVFTTKKVIDDLFLEAMLSLGVPKFIAWQMYQAVHHFGNPDGHPLALNAQHMHQHDTSARSLYEPQRPRVP